MAAEETFERHSYDVVVIGAGGAGLRAAIAAQDAGARTALICRSPVSYTHLDVYKRQRPYLSPLYSPCIATICGHARAGSKFVHAPTVGVVGPWWAISPAILVLVVPLGFRFTCYYYRKAYYRSIWRSPAACAVKEPHKAYRGESRLPLILLSLIHI